MPINQAKPKYVFTKHEVAILKALGFKKHTSSCYTSHEDEDDEVDIDCNDPEYIGRIVIRFGVNDFLGFNNHIFDTFGGAIDYILNDYSVNIH